MSIYVIKKTIYVQIYHPNRRLYLAKHASIAFPPPLGYNSHRKGGGSMKNIGKTIAECRKKLGFTQEQLGSRLGISSQAVSKWETCDSLPDITLVPKICAVLGITPDELFGMDGGKAEEYSGENALEVISRLFYANHTKIESGAEKLSDKGVFIYDGGSCGFVALEGYRDAVFSADSEVIAKTLSIFAERDVIEVLRHLSFSSPVTVEELSKLSGIEEEKLDKVLFRLIKANVIAYGSDMGEENKRGYIYSTGMGGIFLMLLGCAVTGQAGEKVSPIGQFWVG